jgi:hypothetical protein
MAKTSRALVQARATAAAARKRAAMLRKKYNQPNYKRIATQIAGGALVPVVKRYSPVEEVFGLPLEATGAAALLTAGMFSKGKTADMLIDLGTGMGAVAASKIVEQNL